MSAFARRNGVARVVVPFVVTAAIATMANTATTTNAYAAGDTATNVRLSQDLLDSLVQYGDPRLWADASPFPVHSSSNLNFSLYNANISPDGDVTRTPGDSLVMEHSTLNNTGNIEQEMRTQSTSLQATSSIAVANQQTNGISVELSSSVKLWEIWESSVKFKYDHSWSSTTTKTDSNTTTVSTVSQVVSVPPHCQAIVDSGLAQEKISGKLKASGDLRGTFTWSASGPSTGTLSETFDLVDLAQKAQANGLKLPAGFSFDGQHFTAQVNEMDIAANVYATNYNSTYSFKNLPGGNCESTATPAPRTFQLA
ncbi:ETX/MTX2 family pore-forming toxin [Kitasatospora sp. NPDC052896]|uniref:ETX/MTX2 family pore-forming toxin n=1 Tax=Kitasatospora sp. NPDC052896 TaxID=3364061 RepID=UPI0037C7E7E1